MFYMQKESIMILENVKERLNKIEGELTFIKECL